MSASLNGAPQQFGDVPPGAMDPSVLANLANTMSPAGVLSQMQAEMGRQQAQRAQVVEQATKAATQAGAQYQQAAASPPPQIDPMTRLIMGMGGDVGSIMSGNPAYRERAQGNLDQMHADLVQNRAQNLSSLRDLYEQRAGEARQVGNLDLELKNRELSDRVGKTLDTILQQQREQAAMARTVAAGKNTLANTAAQGRNQQANTRLQGQNEVTSEQTKGAETRKTQENQFRLLGLTAPPDSTGATPGAPVVPASPLERWVTRDDTDLPVPMADLTQIPDKKVQQAVASYVADRRAKGDFIGLVKNAADRQNIDQLKSTLGNMQAIFSDAKKWLPDEQDHGRRAMLGNPVTQPFVLATDPNLRAWVTNRMQAVEQISALMSQGKGARMNQRIIDMAIQNDIPSLSGPLGLSDSNQSADQKYANLTRIFHVAMLAKLGVPGMQDRLRQQVLADAAEAKAQQQGGPRMMTPAALGAPATPGADEADAFRKKR